MKCSRDCIASVAAYAMVAVLALALREMWEWCLPIDPREHPIGVPGQNFHLSAAALVIAVLALAGVTFLDWLPRWPTVIVLVVGWSGQALGFDLWIRGPAAAGDLVGILLAWSLTAVGGGCLCGLGLIWLRGGADFWGGLSMRYRWWEAGAVGGLALASMGWCVAGAPRWPTVLLVPMCWAALAARMLAWLAVGPRALGTPGKKATGVGK